LAELIADISNSAQQQALVSDSVSRNIDSILTVTEHTL
jgi:methyl-accepting chemotaxis protein